MNGGETAYLLLVIAAVCVFMGVMAYEAYRNRHQS